MAVFFEGLFPKDNPKNTRFAINFFTSIGLGGITDNIRDYLKTGQVKGIDSSDESESSDESSSSSSDSSDSSDSEPEDIEAIFKKQQQPEVQFFFISFLISKIFIFRSKKKDALEHLSEEDDDLHLPMSDVVDLRLQRSATGDRQRRRSVGDDLPRQKSVARHREVVRALELQNDVVENAQFRQKKSDDLEAAPRRRNQGGKKRSQGGAAANRDADDRDQTVPIRETSANRRSQKEARKSAKSNARKKRLTR